MGFRCAWGSGGAAAALRVGARGCSCREFPVKVHGAFGLARRREPHRRCRPSLGAGLVCGGSFVEARALEEFVNGAAVPLSPSWGGCPGGGELVGDLLQRFAGSGGTHHSAGSRPSSTNSVTPPQPSEIKQADRAKPGAHLDARGYS